MHYRILYLYILMIHYRNLREELRSLKGITEEAKLKCPACPKVRVYIHLYMFYLIKYLNVDGQTTSIFHFEFHHFSISHGIIIN